MPKANTELRKIKQYDRKTSFVQISNELLNSYSWKNMSINGRRILDRIMIEHTNHAGTENGNLIVTYNDFEEYGVNRNQILKSIKELEDLNLIEIEHGKRRCYNESYPNRFRVTFLVDSCPGENGIKYFTEPKHSWKYLERRKDSDGKK